MNNLPDKSKETSYEAKGVTEPTKLTYCDVCNKDVIVFRQQVSTMPQDTQNEVRRYNETFCAYCGALLNREIVDENVT